MNKKTSGLIATGKFVACTIACAFMVTFISPVVLAQTSAVGAGDLGAVESPSDNSSITILDAPAVQDGGVAISSQPSDADLVAKPVPTTPPVAPDAMIAPVEPVLTPAAPIVAAQPQHSGQYYDSMTTIPGSSLRDSGSLLPTKVDPVTEPGQRYVIVDSVGSANSSEAQYVAASRALKLGRYAAAMEMFEKLYRQNSKDPRILMGLGVAQQEAGFLESAATTYEELLTIQPDHSGAIINLMGLMRGQYPSVTLSRLMDLRGKYPNNPGIPAQIGFINSEMGNYEDAVRYFEIAASMEPRSAMHVFNMAITYDKAGQADHAIKSYERALQLDAVQGSTASAMPREKVYDRLAVLRNRG